MHIHTLTKYLPEDIIRHILSFDDRIVLRKGDGNLIFIHKINKELYKDSYAELLKKRLIKEGRTIPPSASGRFTSISWRT